MEPMTTPPEETIPMRETTLTHEQLGILRQEDDIDSGFPRPAEPAPHPLEAALTDEVLRAAWKAHGKVMREETAIRLRLDESVGEPVIHASQIREVEKLAYAAMRAVLVAARKAQR